MPAIASIYQPTLEAMIVAIALGRVRALAAHVVACLQVEPGIILGPAPRRMANSRLFLMEGGWMTVSNVVGPVMVSFDRLLMAMPLPATAVAWYVTAQEVLLRTLVIPGALTAALFPRFAGVAGHEAVYSGAALYHVAIRAMGGR